MPKTSAGVRFETALTTRTNEHLCKRVMASASITTLKRCPVPHECGTFAEQIAASICRFCLVLDAVLKRSFTVPN